MKKLLSLAIIINLFLTGCVTTKSNLQSINVTYLDKTANLSIIRDVIEEFKKRFDSKSVFRIYSDNSDFTKTFIQKLRYEGYGINETTELENSKNTTLIYSFVELEADKVLFDVIVKPNFRMTKIYSPDEYGNYTKESNSLSVRSDPISINN